MKPPAFESPRDYRDRLARERLARRGVTEAVPTPSGDVSHTAMQSPALTPAEPAPLAAWQKVGKTLSEAAGRVLERTSWARGRVYNPKLLCADLKPSKRSIKAPPGYARDVVEAFARARVVGRDASVPYFMAVVEVIVKIADDGQGYVQRAFKSIGRLARLGRKEDNWGRETVRKCIRWMEDHGWIGTLNALYRDKETRELRRDANVYQLFGKDDAATIGAIEDASARALKRESLTLSRGAVLWGLMVRPWGLNATPSPSNRHHTGTNPAPA